MGVDKKRRDEQRSRYLSASILENHNLYNKRTVFSCAAVVSDLPAYLWAYM